MLAWCLNGAGGGLPSAGAVPPDDVTIDDTAFLLAQDLDPRLEMTRYRERLDALAEECRPLLQGARHPADVIAALNACLFARRQFHVDDDDPAGTNPDNFYLNRVLDRRAGVCTGLSVLYLAVAERLRLPVYGVRVPGHCWVRYDDGVVVQDIETTRQGRAAPPTGDPRTSAAAARPRSLTRRELLSYLVTQHVLTLFARDETARILPYLETALQWDPRNTTAWCLLGLRLAQSGRTAEALAAFDRSVAVDPACATAISLRGVTRAQVGRHREALLDGLKACSLRPRESYYQLQLAAVYLAAGDAHKAQLTLRKAQWLASLDGPAPRN